MTDITGVDFVAIMTKDHDAAVKFYGETLGLPFVKQWGNMPGSEFQAGNLTLAVMQPDAFGFEWSPSSTMIALQVDDVAATRAAARGGRRGVPRRDPRLRRLPPVVLRRPGRQPARTCTTATRLRRNPLRAACRRSRRRAARSPRGSARGRRRARSPARSARRRRRGSARPATAAFCTSSNESRPLTHSTLPCSGSAPSSSARPITLSIALWRPTSSRTHSSSPSGVKQPGGVQPAGAREARLAQPLGQVGEQRARDRSARAAAARRGPRPPPARPSRTPRTRTWCRSERADGSRVERPGRPRSCWPRGPAVSPAARGPSIRPSPYRNPSASSSSWPGRAHRHGERRAVDADLQRLLDRDLVGDRRRAPPGESGSCVRCSNVRRADHHVPSLTLCWSSSSTLLTAPSVFDAGRSSRCSS